MDPSSDRARTRSSSAPPLVENTFDPVRRHRPFASSTGTARVETLPSAEPAPASESDMQQEISPVAMPGTKRCFKASLPKRSRVSPHPWSA